MCKRCSETSAGVSPSALSRRVKPVRVYLAGKPGLTFPVGPALKGGQAGGGEGGGEFQVPLRILSHCHLCKAPAPSGLLPDTG